jgi:hypothetical protein
MNGLIAGRSTEAELAGSLHVKSVIFFVEHSGGMRS